MRSSVTAWQAVLTVPVFVLLYGWRAIDLSQWRAITAAPFDVTVEPASQFLYASPLTFLLGAFYQRQGLGFDAAFLVVHGIGFLLLAYALYHSLTRLCSQQYWSAGALVLAASPLLLIAVTWIGKSDTYLAALYLLLLSSASRFTQAVLCVLMIACHREIAVAMLIGHALIRGAHPLLIGGGAAGLALSLLYTHGLLETVPASRWDYLLANARLVVASVVAHPFAHALATLGPFWLYVMRPSMLATGRVSILAVAAVLAAVTLDFTRVFVLVALPLIVQLTQELVDEIRHQGAVRLFGYPVPVNWLGLLAFLQFQIAGDRLLWIRNVTWTLGR